MSKYTAIYNRAAKYANRKRETDDSDYDVLWNASYFIRKCGLDHFGFECASFEPDDDNYDDRHIEYLNMGDTYAETIICENGECYVGCWGNWVEEVEKEYCKEEDKIKCAHCGAFPDVADDWQRTECPDCDHYVDGSDIPEPGSQLSDCTELMNCDSGINWIDNTPVETHKTKSRYTRIFARLQYTGYWDSSWESDCGRYHVELIAVNPGIIPKKEIDGICSSMGVDRDDWDGLSIEHKCELCVDYGTYAKLWQDTGNNSDALMTALEEQRRIHHTIIGFKLDGPQNAIGTSGWDFMKGNVLGKLGG